MKAARESEEEIELELAIGLQVLQNLLLSKTRVTIGVKAEVQGVVSRVRD
jgi:hypothetical protein